MMQVHRDIAQLPPFRKAVVTIGTFDGVHTGHRQIIRQLNQEAAAIGGESVIITFHPHPRKVVRAGQSPVWLLNTIDEKIQLLDAAGVDHLVIVPFTEQFSALSAREYVEAFLVDRFYPHTVIIGYDHHFGKGRAGDYKLLEEYSTRGVFKLQEIPAHLLNQSSVSSTAIREALLAGAVATANELLGYPYFFEGQVVTGNKIGRTIGFPTANLKIADPEKLIPANAVYAVWAQVSPPEPLDNPAAGAGTRYWMEGMMNIGIRPTVAGKTRAIEVNLFNTDQDLYHKTLRVALADRIRFEQKFEGLEALSQQLRADEQAAKKMLARGIAFQMGNLSK